MKMIKRIEIRDENKDYPGVLIGLPDILKVILNGEDFYWGVLPIFDPMGIHEQKPQEISIEIDKQISEKELAVINWEDLQILAQGVCQFFDLLIIGCKNHKDLKPYQDDDEMIKSCDIIIMMFDTCWWEVSCKDEKLMQKFIDSFEKVKIVNWDEDQTPSN